MAGHTHASYENVIGIFECVTDYCYELCEMGRYFHEELGFSGYSMGYASPFEEFKINGVEISTEVYAGNPILNGTRFVKESGKYIIICDW